MQANNKLLYLNLNTFRAEWLYKIDFEKLAAEQA